MSRWVIEHFLSSELGLSHNRGLQEKSLLPPVLALPAGLPPPGCCIPSLGLSFPFCETRDLRWGQRGGQPLSSLQEPIWGTRGEISLQGRGSVMPSGPTIQAPDSSFRGCLSFQLPLQVLAALSLGRTAGEGLVLGLHWRQKAVASSQGSVPSPHTPVASKAGAGKLAICPVWLSGSGLIAGLPVQESTDKRPKGDWEGCPGRAQGHLWAAGCCSWKHPVSMVLNPQ